MPFWRSFHQAVYHTCQRCGFRQKLEDMKWQNGILICGNAKCIDTAIIGSHEINVARAVAVNRHEFEPDRKLVEAVDRKIDQNDILY